MLHHILSMIVVGYFIKYVVTIFISVLPASSYSMYETKTATLSIYFNNKKLVCIRKTCCFFQNPNKDWLYFWINLLSVLIISVRKLKFGCIAFFSTTYPHFLGSCNSYIHDFSLSLLFDKKCWDLFWGIKFFPII